MTRNNTAGLNKDAMKDRGFKNTDGSRDRLLSVKNLTVTFETDEGRFTAADRVSFDIRRGESVGLVGESGCGKSVTALSVSRLIPSPPGSIDSGEVFFEGRDLLAAETGFLRKIRGSAVSMIFQEPLSALSPLHRVGRQMVETVRLHRDMTKDAAWAFSVQWLKKVGIPDPEKRMYAYPFQLSGGMQQRIMIAMALMLEPKLIIADEPTTALDVTTQAQVFALIKGMKKNDTAMLLITHDMGAVWEMCERVMVMYASRLVETGSLEDIFTRPAHPYTLGLLNAIPQLFGKKGFFDIPGQVPSPFAYSRGCRFSDRCAFAFDRCRNETPPMVDCGKGHFAACFLASNKGISGSIPLDSV